MLIAIALLFVFVYGVLQYNFWQVEKELKEIKRLIGKEKEDERL